MSRWWPWLLAFVVWNATFDLSVRQAAHQFTADQVARWDAGETPVLIRDALNPAVDRAALRATGLAVVVLAVAAGWRRRRGALVSHR